MSGYVRIHRSLIGHPAFRNDAEAMAFAWLVTKAAWKATRIRYKERAINLKRGQVAVSVRDFAHAMDRDKAWIERLLNRLRGETMIKTHNETGVNVITVCNYGAFQAEQDSAETPIETINETEARQRRDTEQEREEYNIPPVSPKIGKTLIPESWQPPTVSELPVQAKACAEQWPAQEYVREAEAFVCYWRSERKMKSDWRLTWANRILDQHDRVMRRNKPIFGDHGQPNYLETVRRELAQRASPQAAGGRG